MVIFSGFLIIISFSDQCFCVDYYLKYIQNRENGKIGTTRVLADKVRNIIFSNINSCIENAVSDGSQKRHYCARRLFQITIGGIIENSAVLVKTGTVTGAVPRMFRVIVFERTAEVRTAFL